MGSNDMNPIECRIQLARYMLPRESLRMTILGKYWNNMQNGLYL